MLAERIRDTAWYQRWHAPELGTGAPGALFAAEPGFLLYDEPRSYRAVFQAIGAGAHSLNEIANLALISKTHRTRNSLARLHELRLGGGVPARVVTP